MSRQTHKKRLEQILEFDKLTQYELDFGIVEAQIIQKYSAICPKCNYYQIELIREKDKNGILSYRMQCAFCEARTLSTLHADEALHDWRKGRIYKIDRDGYPY